MQAPEVLGRRFELRGVLGRGGMAEVRDGWDTRLDRPVAIKLLYPVFSMQPDNRRRFEIEARAAAALNHLHIVAVHDSGDHDGTPYIVMARLSGRTLADVLFTHSGVTKIADFGIAKSAETPHTMTGQIVGSMVAPGVGREESGRTQHGRTHPPNMRW